MSNMKPLESKQSSSHVDFGLMRKGPCEVGDNVVGNAVGFLVVGCDVGDSVIGSIRGTMHFPLDDRVVNIRWLTLLGNVLT